jgi:hypothetical protein
MSTLKLKQVYVGIVLDLVRFACFDRLRKLEEVAKHESLPEHSNCVRFLKAWEEKQHLYIQTELCKTRYF